MMTWKEIFRLTAITIWHKYKYRKDPFYKSMEPFVLRVLVFAIIDRTTKGKHKSIL